MPPLSEFMQALVFDGPAADTATSRIAELPAPEPGPGQVTIDVAYAGVNFKDVMARRGDPGYVPAWPFVPGLEVSGTVRALGAGVAGSGVAGFGVGQRVAALTSAGGLAEVATASADLVVAVPEDLDLERAAAAPGALTTAALLLDIGHLAAGEAVLVHGAAGGVGQAVARLAHIAGARVVLGTVGSAARVAAATEAGYDATLVRGPGLAAAIRERTAIGERTATRECTAGRGVDLVLDPQGTALLDLDLEVAAPGARLVMFGNAGGGPIAALPPLGRLFAANVSIGGFSLAALAECDPMRLAAALDAVLGRLAAGELDIELTSVEGLAAAPCAQQALAEGRGPGKQVVRVARPARGSR